MVNNAVPKTWSRVAVLMLSTFTLVGCFDPAKDTCDANDVLSKMTNLVQHSFGFLAIEGLELGLNGYKASDGQNMIRYRYRMGEIRTEGYDTQARIASCTGVFHFDVAPHGDDQKPEEQWSKHDLKVKYQVRLGDHNEFLLDNDDWDWR